MSKEYSEDLIYPPIAVDLGYFNYFDPKSDAQYMATMIWGPKNNQLRLLTTSLTGGKVAENFTLELTVDEPGGKCMLEQARDPTTNLYKIQRSGRAEIGFKVDGKEYFATLLLNPKNTDLTNFHVIRCGESQKYAIRGGIVRAHHSGWWALVAMLAIIVTGAVVSSNF